MTPEWKEEVRAALRLRGASEQWLAEQVGARRKTKIKRDTINKLLRKQKSSSLVPDICAILGLRPPMVATPNVPDAKTSRLIELVLAAPEPLKDAVILLLEQRSKI
jgi:hypothetical protein